MTTGAGTRAVIATDASTAVIDLAPGSGSVRPAPGSPLPARMNEAIRSKA